MRPFDRFVIPIIVLLVSAHADAVRPIQLLAPDETGTALVATPEGLNVLRGTFGKTPIAVVSYVGLGRTGKSFGLNSLLGVPHREGFRVGHGYEPETTGAWIWPEWVSSSGLKEAAIVLIDTEGLGVGAQVFDKVWGFLCTKKTKRPIRPPGIARGDCRDLFSARLPHQHVLVRGRRSEVAWIGVSGGGLRRTGHTIRRFVLCVTKRSPDNREAILPHITWVVNRDSLRHTPGQSDKDTLFSTTLAEKENPDDNAQIAMFNATVSVVKNAFTGHAVHLLPTAAPPGIDESWLTELAFEDLASGYVDGVVAMREELAREVRGLIRNRYFLTKIPRSQGACREAPTSTRS
jgi:hypothetical protein